ncbi:MULTISPECIES: hypothetical protein [Exiguobacterium]|uniref:Uncharacterized protein n=1 Tax=Exiguobacterium antarcticum TaxID=132920 RepID=A0ABT6R0Y9_9BACL|nr:MULTISPECIES: hypothetical protein [Exiguobacterium]MCT4781027.1 hypothetical protein [Exiguobacterium soli]MDI3234604.1 hypothetical protein [Exiguobacterium antarcticum]
MISFVGYDETLVWQIVEVNPIIETLQIEVLYQDMLIHEMMLSFSEYDQFASRFRRVHEQLPGVVSFQDNGFLFKLVYDRLGHVRIEWCVAGEPKHVLPSDQSYIGQALALMGVYT